MYSVYNKVGLKILKSVSHTQLGLAHSNNAETTIKHFAVFKSTLRNV